MVSDDFEEHKSIKSENKKELTVSQEKLRESLSCEGNKVSSEQIKKESINEDAEIKQDGNADAVNGNKDDQDDTLAGKEAAEKKKGQ